MAENNQRFESFQEWVNKASSWLQRHPNYSEYFRAICFDNNGKICLNGGDIKTAKFPVHWVWPDQNLFERIDAIRAEAKS